MQPVIKDFDAIVKPKRIAILGGKRIDVSKIPTRVMVELLQMLDSESAQETDTFFKMVDVVVKVCNDPEITPDWLYDNTEMDILLDFTEFVIEPIKNRGEAGAQPKN